MTPNYLKKKLEKAEDLVDSLKPLANIPTMQDRIQRANKDLGDVLSLIEQLKSYKKRKYEDQEVFAVLDSGLSQKGNTPDHVALAVELNMNYNSMLYFLQMRDWCNGEGKWKNTQTRVINYIGKDQADCAMLIEANAEELKQYNERKKEKSQCA